MPIRGNKLYCPACNYEQPQVNLVKCKRCSHDLGAPNVNEVSLEDEIKALKERYYEARNKGNKEALDAFEQYFTDRVQAVINISVKELKLWLTDDAYKNYHRLLEEGKIDIKPPDQDKMRNVVDICLFASYGRDIIFAALSLNNSGVKSYGKCTVTLNERLIDKRASILEENSFNFVVKYDIRPAALNIPKGYRSTWDDKKLLAVAKLYNLLTPSCTNDDLCELVLSSDGKKNNEEFIEVHIYNELSTYTIKSVYIRGQSNRKDIFDIKKSMEKFPGKIFID